MGSTQPGAGDSELLNKIGASRTTRALGGR